MFTALTLIFLSVVLAVRVFFYVPMRHAMANVPYDRLSFVFLDMMYWGFMLMVGVGYAAAVITLYRTM